MIKTIPKVRNVASYAVFDWDELNQIAGTDKAGDAVVRDGALQKYNIFYGENGNGKSKLVDILKSLNGEDVSLEKHWDQPDDEQSATVLLEDNLRIEYAGVNGWDDPRMNGKFVIFDEHYIETYVHSVGPRGWDTSQRRQHRGESIVYLGQFGEFNEQINKVASLKNAVARKNDTFLEREQTRVQGALTTNGITFENVVENRAMVEKADTLEERKQELEKKQAELIKLQNAIVAQAQIVGLKKLNDVQSPPPVSIEATDGDETVTADLDVQNLLSFTVSRGVKTTLHRIAHKKDFIKQGMALIGDDTQECPFCDQKIRNGGLIGRIRDYQSIFDDLFAREQTHVARQLRAYQNVLEELGEWAPPADNQDAFFKLKRFVSVDKELPQLGISDADRITIKEERSLVQTKLERPLDQVTGSRCDEVERIVVRIQTQGDAYNECVLGINDKLETLKKDLSEGRLETRRDELVVDVDTRKREVFFAENSVALRRYLQAVDTHRENVSVIDSLERIFQALKGTVVERFNTFVAEYFDLIKKYVQEISPTMAIFEFLGDATYDRRSREPAQCGFRVEYNGSDRSGDLSKGEKQVVALSFFFAQLEKDEDKDKVVVLDDPISSFDAGKRKATADVIRRAADDYRQLLVLTCDTLFREFCLKAMRNNRSFYYIFNSLGSSAIHFVPRNRDTIYSSFESDFRDLDNVRGTSENVVVYGQKLRFCLETKIKEDYFGYSEDNLASMIERVTSKGGDEFRKLFDNKERILGLYSYCNTGGLAHYPRDGSTSWNELKEKIKQYLELAL